MATKLLRLTADEKKAAMQNGGQQQPLRVHQFSELEEREAELQMKVRQLEKQNTTLQNKVKRSKGERRVVTFVKWMLVELGTCICSSSCMFTSWW